MNLAVNRREVGQRLAGNFWQTVALDHEAAKDPNTIRQHLPKLQFFKTDEMPFWQPVSFRRPLPCVLTALSKNLFLTIRP